MNTDAEPGDSRVSTVSSVDSQGAEIGRETIGIDRYGDLEGVRAQFEQ